MEKCVLSATSSRAGCARQSAGVVAGPDDFPATLRHSGRCSQCERFGAHREGSSAFAQGSYSFIAAIRPIITAALGSKYVQFVIGVLFDTYLFLYWF